jgi:ABC-2 type transport system permease protein
VAIALRTGSAEVVQATFPVFFISLFASSAFFPRQLMQGWFKAVATVNPMSFMIEAVRALVITGFSVADALEAIGVVAVIFAVALFLSLAALRRRLRVAA